MNSFSCGPISPLNCSGSLNGSYVGNGAGSVDCGSVSLVSASGAGVSAAGASCSLNSDGAAGVVGVAGLLLSVVGAAGSGAGVGSTVTGSEVVTSGAGAISGVEGVAEGVADSAGAETGATEGDISAAGAGVAVICTSSAICVPFFGLLFS